MYSVVGELHFGIFKLGERFCRGGDGSGRGGVRIGGCGVC